MTRKWENAMTLDKSSWGYRRNGKVEQYLTIEVSITKPFLFLLQNDSRNLYSSGTAEDDGSDDLQRWEFTGERWPNQGGDHPGHHAREAAADGKVPGGQRGSGKDLLLLTQPFMFSSNRWFDLNLDLRIQALVQAQRHHDPRRLFHLKFEGNESLRNVPALAN